MQLILWLVFLLILAVSSAEHNSIGAVRNNQSKNKLNPGIKLSALRQSVHPYAFKSNEFENDTFKGPVSSHLDRILGVCFESEAILEYTDISNQSQDTEYFMNDEQVVFPVRKQLQDLIIETGMSQDYKYIPVIESPGAVILIEDERQRRYILIEFFEECWSFALLVFSSVLLAGIIIWILDHQRNTEEFPEPFLKGSWEGIWWAFVTMTTVGYGDRFPRSIPGRIFGLLWMLVGIIMMSIFTATLTMAFTSDQSEEATINGSKLGVLRGSREEILAIKGGAQVKDYTNLTRMKDDLLSKEIDGILLDAYEARFPVKWMTGLKEAAYIEDSTFFGIILQNQTDEIQQCFIRETSKSQSKIYRELMHLLKRRAKRNQMTGQKLRESTAKAFRGMKYLDVAVTVAWVVMAIACLVWQFVQQHMMSKKIHSPAGGKKIFLDGELNRNHHATEASRFPYKQNQ